MIRPARFNAVCALGLAVLALAGSVEATEPALRPAAAGAPCVSENQSGDRLTAPFGFVLRRGARARRRHLLGSRLARLTGDSVFVRHVSAPGAPVAACEPTAESADSPPPDRPPSAA